MIRNNDEAPGIDTSLWTKCVSVCVCVCMFVTFRIQQEWVWPWVADIFNFQSCGSWQQPFLQPNLASRASFPWDRKESSSWLSLPSSFPVVRTKNWRLSTCLIVTKRRTLVYLPHLVFFYNQSETKCRHWSNIANGSKTSRGVVQLGFHCKVHFQLIPGGWYQILVTKNCEVSLDFCFCPNRSSNDAVNGHYSTMGLWFLYLIGQIIEPISNLVRKRLQRHGTWLTWVNRYLSTNTIIGNKNIHHLRCLF